MINPTATKTSPFHEARSNPPWWKEPMCWVVIAGPAAVVVASLLTAVVAWKHIDPIIQEDRSGRSQVEIQGPPGSSTGPALQGRNHAAAPMTATSTGKVNP